MRKQKRSSFRIPFVSQLLIVLLFSMAAKARAQLGLLVDATNTEQTTTLNLTNPQVILLRVTVRDADTTNEGTLTINGRPAINIFGGAKNTYNNRTTELNVTLNAAQRAYFVEGNNTLIFRYVREDGFQIEKIEAVYSLPLVQYSEVLTNSVDAAISPNRLKALEIYKRLSGVRTSIDNPILVQMEDLLDRGEPQQAAALVTAEPSFYNLVVRDFAARMSTRDETINTTMNDFTATVIGITRDDIDARQMLNGDFFYMGGPQATVARDLLVDVVTSNIHYTQLETGNYDFSSVLTRVDQQMIRASGGSLTAHPDAAGVITSRAFMEAHATAGTNRRLVEYTFKQFTCSNIEEWADAQAPDHRVGRDIDRFPGGEAAKYQTTCKACHSVMDGFRGAFAAYDFSDNFMKYAPFYPNAGGANGLSQSPMGVARKMNGNDNTFASGFRTTDSTWVNNATSPSNRARFGWRGVASSGSGVKQLATAVANSKAFSKCMVQKVYREVCRRPIASFEQEMVDRLSQQFESDGYNLKRLFQQVAVQKECLGVN